MYKIKLFFWNIRNIIRWIPVLWNNFDWDYNFMYDIMRFKIERMAHYQRNNGHLVNNELYASRMDTFIRLLNKVREEEYLFDHNKTITEKYGNWKFDFIEYNKEDDGGGKWYSAVKKWEKDYTPQQIEDIEKESDMLFESDIKQQAKAERILWKFFTHNVRHWWD